MKKKVLITGGTKGIGLEVAKMMLGIRLSSNSSRERLLKLPT